VATSGPYQDASRWRLYVPESVSSGSVVLTGASPSWVYRPVWRAPHRIIHLVLDGLTGWVGSYVGSGCSPHTSQQLPWIDWPSGRVNWLPSALRSTQGGVPEFPPPRQITASLSLPGEAVTALVIGIPPPMYWSETGLPVVRLNVAALPSPIAARHRSSVGVPQLGTQLPAERHRRTG
jgi:hypothetical protein